jgi:proteasome lid subunit RPN8/RPN11
VIRLSNAHHDAIARHGEADFPHECCGLLIGAFDQAGVKSVSELRPISNSREDGAKHNRFLITPEDLMRAERQARALKLDVLGFYHSHPDCPAIPSQFDLDHAWPVYSYVIVSVRQGRAAELTSWELAEDRSKFLPEQILEVQ